VRRVVVTGLGFISSIGNNREQLFDSLRHQRSGIELHPELDLPISPVRLAGTIKGFSFPSEDYKTWKIPKEVPLSRKELRSMSPHVIYAYAVGGYPVDKTAFQSSMPAGIKYVIFPFSMNWGSSELRRLLPIQSVPTKNLNLERHDVWGISGKIQE